MTARPLHDVETCRKNAGKRGWLKGSKVCITGFTPSREEAPWDDPEFDIRVCNNLWRQFPGKIPDRLYDPHTIKSIREGDAEHLKFLQQNGKVPCYVAEAQDDWPTSITLPRQEIQETFPFGDYVTNTISWMIAHALYEGPPKELWVVGVDLATGTEYASQRPSAEMWLGIASQLCEKVYIPQTSDLLKSAVQYGFEDDSAMQAKMRALIEERKKQLAEMQGQLSQLDEQYRHQGEQLRRQYDAQRLQMMNAIGQCQGAVEQLQYLLGVWHQPQVDRENPQQRDPALMKIASEPALVGSDGRQTPERV